LFEIEAESTYRTNTSVGETAHERPLFFSVKDRLTSIVEEIRDYVSRGMNVWGVG
jgi:hypothetical protein